jgi:hypothetical protein
MERENGLDSGGLPRNTDTAVVTLAPGIGRWSLNPSLAKAQDAMAADIRRASVTPLHGISWNGVRPTSPSNDLRKEALLQDLFSQHVRLYKHFLYDMSLTYEQAVLERQSDIQSWVDGYVTGNDGTTSADAACRRWAVKVMSDCCAPPDRYRCSWNRVPP